MDIVRIDTGHSYEGLCQYFQGQYITYSEERPITMNPFNITKGFFLKKNNESIFMFRNICIYLIASGLKTWKRFKTGAQ
jgi:hypothetical protein